MKKIFLLITITLLLTGCFKDKSEEAIKNCADTVWSIAITDEFEKEFIVGWVYSWDQKTENIFDESVLALKQGGFTYEETRQWAQELKTKETDVNEEVINHFIEIRNKINKSIDDHLKLSLTDRLQNEDYEKPFGS